MITVHEVLGQNGDYNFPGMMADQALQLGPATQLPSEQLINEQGWTLYEFDYARRIALFVDVGAETNLFAAPFAYTAQLRAARRLALVDFEKFLELSAQITSSNRIIHFYNIGHCGSTLMYHVFNAGGEA